MKLIEFKEQDVIIAESQPEYLNMPAHLEGDEQGTVTVCWKLSFIEKIKIIFTGKIWHQILTFNSKIQPVRMLVNKPEMK